MKDFTLAAYETLIDCLVENVGPLHSVIDWHLNSPSRGVLVRHDVDRKPWNALAMAELEAKKGFSTTYYFRVVGSAWNKEVIQEIATLGHEIGYHYEDLTLAYGDLNLAHRLFSEHLQMFREICSVRTVTMHGSPLSKHNNIDMWKIGERSDYDVVVDAFLDVNYSGMPYFTDTGRCWGKEAVNLRDMPATALLPPPIAATEELVNFVRTKRPAQLALSAHPERWATRWEDWAVQLAKDFCVNSIKRTLRAIR